jgi:hypothetical protein
MHWALVLIAQLSHKISKNHHPGALKCKSLSELATCVIKHTLKPMVLDTSRKSDLKILRGLSAQLLKSRNLRVD